MQLREIMHRPDSVWWRCWRKSNDLGVLIIELKRTNVFTSSSVVQLESLRYANKVWAMPLYQSFSFTSRTPSWHKLDHGRRQQLILAIKTAINSERLRQWGRRKQSCCFISVRHVSTGWGDFSEIFFSLYFFIWCVYCQFKRNNPDPPSDRKLNRKSLRLLRVKSHNTSTDGRKSCDVTF